MKLLPSGCSSPHRIITEAPCVYAMQFVEGNNETSFRLLNLLLLLRLPNMRIEIDLQLCLRFLSRWWGGGGSIGFVVLVPPQLTLTLFEGPLINLLHYHVLYYKTAVYLQYKNCRPLLPKSSVILPLCPRLSEK